MEQSNLWLKQDSEFMAICVNMTQRVCRHRTTWKAACFITELVHQAKIWHKAHIVLTISQISFFYIRWKIKLSQTHSLLIFNTVRRQVKSGGVLVHCGYWGSQYVIVTQNILQELQYLLESCSLPTRWPNY